MKRLFLFAIASSFLNAIICAVGKIPLMLEKDILCQSKELNYWNAIILNDFKANANADLPAIGIDGPLIIGSDLAINNYYINSKGKMDCTSKYNESIPLTEYGLYMNKLDSTSQNYYIKDAVISGSIQLNGNDNNNVHFKFLDSIVRPMQSCRLLVNSPDQHNTPLISNYDRIAKKTSLYLALQKSTHTLTEDGVIKAVSSHSDDKYYYFNFASCTSNLHCDISSEKAHLSHPNAFSQAKHTIQWPKDKPIILNIPVTRNSTFKLASLEGFTSQLPACSTVWNFFAVDEEGVIDKSDQQAFTVSRSTESLIGGTFLLPYGNVVDGAVGGFAGQLIAANYESQGASLYDFEAVSQSCHAKDASCWPSLSKNDIKSEKLNEKEEQDDELDWIVRRGRQFLPVSNDGSGLLIDEINRAVASTATATVTEHALPSEMLPFSGADSQLDQSFSAAQSVHAQNFLVENNSAFLNGPQNQDKVIINPTSPEEIEAFMDAFPGRQPKAPLMEPPADFVRVKGYPHTTLTDYVSTITKTHFENQVFTTETQDDETKTIYSTTTVVEYTATTTYTVQVPQIIDAEVSFSLSFDMLNDRIVTIYDHLNPI